MGWDFVLFAKKSLTTGEGGRLIASGVINTGTVLTVLFAIIIGAFSLGSLGPRVESFAKATAAAQKIFQALVRVPPIDSLSDRGDNPDDIQGNIELKNVSFIYPARPEVVVLKDVNIHIPKGKFTAGLSLY